MASSSASTTRIVIGAPTVADTTAAKPSGTPSLLAGVASIAAPLLLAVATYTTPPPDNDSNEAHIASLPPTRR